MFVLSSPSGAGKTTLAKRLLAEDDNLHNSVSVTTRPPREGEVDGVDYYFVSQAEFDRRASAGELLEWAAVFTNSYGTPKGAVLEALERGKDVLFDIDWQGARQVRQRAGEDIVSVFIMPPSVGALEERLLRRAQDSRDIVEHRMNSAGEEICHWREYDYVVVNENVDTSLAQLRTILAAERCRTRRQGWLSDFADGLHRQLEARGKS